MNMPIDRKLRRSSLGLVVLWLLVEEPMHVYRMQKLIEAQGKQRVVNVRSPASLYQTIKRLERLGLVEVEATIRGDSQPDRTVYRITDSGREVAHQWLLAMLGETGGDYPEFIAALSMLAVLVPDQALQVLEKRADQLAAELADVESQLAGNPGLPRLFLLEEEYRRAVLQAESAWLRAVCADISSGRLSWDEEWIRQVGAEFIPANDDL